MMTKKYMLPRNGAESLSREPWNNRAMPCYSVKVS